MAVAQFNNEANVSESIRMLNDSLIDEEFFYSLSQLISSGQARSLNVNDLLAASVRLAKPNAHGYFNSYAYAPTVSLINNLLSFRNAERLAVADGRLSYAALVLAMVSLIVSCYDAFVR